MQEYIPAAVEVELTNKPEWSSSESSLMAEFNLKVPGWVEGRDAGRWFPSGFSAARRNMYSTTPIGSTRSILIFPSKNTMTSLSSSQRLAVSSLPPAQKQDGQFVTPCKWRTPGTRCI